jgi:hypothetical protein
MNDDANLDRRTFLKRSAVGAFGFAGGVGQDEPERARYTRRMALRYPERLEGGPRRKIVLLTDRTNDDPDVSEVDGCGFSNWPPDRLTIWEGIIVDWENAAGDLGFSFPVSGSQPTVRANRLVERDKIFLDEQETPVPLGTPFIVNGVEECPGEYRGLTATQIPGIDIKTGSD